MFNKKNNIELKSLRIENILLTQRINDLVTNEKRLVKQVEDLNNKYGDLRGLIFLNAITK